MDDSKLCRTLDDFCLRLADRGIRLVQIRRHLDQVSTFWRGR